MAPGPGEPRVLQDTPATQKRGLPATPHPPPCSLAVDEVCAGALDLIHLQAEFLQRHDPPSRGRRESWPLHCARQSGRAGLPGLRIGRAPIAWVPESSPIPSSLHAPLGNQSSQSKFASRGAARLARQLAAKPHHGAPLLAWSGVWVPGAGSCMRRAACTQASGTCAALLGSARACTVCTCG